MRDYSLREVLNIFCNVSQSSIVNLKFHFKKIIIGDIITLIPGSMSFLGINYWG